MHLTSFIHMSRTGTCDLNVHDVRGSVSWPLPFFVSLRVGLGIYTLNLLIGFLSPQVDPESEGPALPMKGSDEFKPFVRRLPEFKFW